jgi:soluble lytic murein transglycosylase-like protein
MGKRLAAVGLAAFALGALAGSARGEAAGAMLERPPAEAESTSSLAGLRAVVASEARHLGAELRDTIVHAVARASREQGISAFLLVSLIAQESGFDPSAENAGALGLMQLRPFVAKDYARRRGLGWRGDAMLRDPAQNVALASGYLGELVDRFESLDLALAAYNKGPEAVKHDLRDDLEPRQDFVDDVMRRYQRYQVRFGGI